MKRTVALFLLALVAVLSLSTPSSAAPSAEDLFKQGREAVQQKNWQRAHELLSKSWALKKSFDTAALLGQAELRLEKHRAAAEHLDYALRHFPNLSPTPDARERIEQGLETAKQHVYALTIEVKPEGAELFVDTDPVGRAPLEAPVFLEPGPHQIEATFEGYERGGQKVEATAGQKGRLALVLTKSGGASATPPPPPTGSTSTPPSNGKPPVSDAPATEPGKKSMVPVIVAGGVTVLGLAGALVFELSRSSAASDAEAIAKTTDPKGCGTGTSTPDECAELHDENESKEEAKNYRNASLVTAGVAGVALITYLLWPTESSSTEAHRRTTITATPQLSRTKAGLSLSGSF